MQTSSSDEDSSRIAVPSEWLVAWSWKPTDWASVEWTAAETIIGLSVEEWIIEGYLLVSKGSSPSGLVLQVSPQESSRAATANS